MISTFSRTQNFANGLMSLHKVTLTRCPLDANEGNVLPARFPSNMGFSSFEHVRIILY